MPAASSDRKGPGTMKKGEGADVLGQVARFWAPFHLLEQQF